VVAVYRAVRVQMREGEIAVVDAAGGGLARNAMTASEAWFPNVRSEATAERLFELDTWVRRHAEPDDPQLCTQPVKATVGRDLAGAERVSPSGSCNTD
jgi:hypothetical protein